jgi:hypothetical protein
MCTSSTRKAGRFEVTAATPEVLGLHELVARISRHGDVVSAVIESMNGARFVHDQLELLRGDHFKRRHLNMRPKADPTELIGWSSFAMSIGLKPPDGSDHADEPHAQTATIRGGPEAEVLRNVTPSTRALVLELVRASPPELTETHWEQVRYGDYEIQFEVSNAKPG